jgi:peptidoglycan/xylan/chitin deacetylase (PgdA/CDA1 family)
VIDEQRADAARRTVLLGGAAALGLAACATASSPAGRGPSDPGAPAGSAGPVPSGATPAAGAPSSGAPTSSGAGPAVLRQPGPDIASGSAASAAVALTFHGAGDLALTTRVLAVLAAAGARVTVFAVGQWLDANPAVGRQIVGAGHDLGNHTWSHQAMTSLSATAAEDEIRRGADAVARSVGAPGLLFRPSGTPASTATIRAAAALAGYQRCISYDVDPEDFLDPGAPLVTSRTLSAVKAGSIVSLHLGHPGTADALPAILRGLADRRLRPASVTELLSRP